MEAVPTSPGHGWYRCAWPRYWFFAFVLALPIFSFFNGQPQPKHPRLRIEHLASLPMADLSQSLVASLARALNAAEVPCVLWGHCLLGLHGVPSIVGASITSPPPLRRFSKETDTTSSRSILSFPMTVWTSRRKPSQDASASCPAHPRTHAPRRRRSDTRNHRRSTPTSTATMK